MKIPTLAQLAQRQLEFEQTTLRMIGELKAQIDALHFILEQAEESFELELYLRIDPSGTMLFDSDLYQQLGQPPYLRLHPGDDSLGLEGRFVRTDSTQDRPIHANPDGSYWAQMGGPLRRLDWSLPEAGHWDVYRTTEGVPGFVWMGYDSTAQVN